MTERSDRPIVGRRGLVDSLVDAFTQSENGPRTVLLDGRPGGGRRTVVRRFLARLEEEEVPHSVLRFQAMPGDEGVRVLMRAYAAMVTALNRRGAFDEDPAEILTDVGVDAEDDRSREQLYSLAANLKELGGRAAGNFQIKLPADNPYLGMMTALDALGPRGRWVIELYEVGRVISPAFWVFLSALVGRARARNWKVLFVVTPGENRYSEKPGDSEPGPLGFLRTLTEGAETLTVEPLTAEQVAELVDETYRPHKFPPELAARIHAMSKGHADTVHELLDALEEDETITWDDKSYGLSDLDDVDLEILVPIAQEAEFEAEEGDDSDDSDDGDEADGADADDEDEGIDPEFLERVLHVAAIEGREFTAALLRTWLEAGEDEVDDALDSMPHLVEESRYHEALGTWTYRFRFGFYRDWYLNNPPESFKQKPATVAKELATVMLQSYAPAAFEYIERSAELYTAGSDGRGARTLLGMAMGTDRPELTHFAMEVVERFEDSPWPGDLARMVFFSHAERGINAETPQQAEAAIERVREWAKARKDPLTLAQLKLLECRVEIRKRNWQAAAERGQEALQAFQAQGESRRAAEVLNQLAMVAMNSGDLKGAQNWVKQAEKASTLPPVKAHSLYIRGLLARAQGSIPQAATLFTRSVELCTTTGNLVLTLEAMLQAGETSLMAGKGKEVVGVLQRAVEMSRALRSLDRERVSARLLCQALAADGKPEAALEMAKHALELTRELGATQHEAVDLYHCGLFAVVAGKQEEGLSFLDAARGAAEGDPDSALLPDVLFNIGQVKASQRDFSGGRAALEQALGIVRAKKDRGRELRILESLGVLASAEGNHEGAVARLKEAADLAAGPQAKDFRKALRKRIAQEEELARQAQA